jgi:uncharacterized protein
MESAVTHHPQDERGEFSIERERKRIARMTYSRHGNRVEILHTEVDPSLRGTGAGQRLVAAAVEWARDQHLQVVPLCPFAKSVFTRMPDFGDVL